ncbi:MBL fold metallo-hydrolase [Nitrospira sp. KM1]|uniref:MBL fold metallo-hydrolase n=1 Tax=Nitrospira sp. KM1 TaxID=1936990 RepID=UPI001563E7FB|nr:MBL fold metallo-hydrolase [Nitrospira sp. KM1]
MSAIKWMAAILICGALAVHAPRAEAQTSRPDDEITKLTEHVYLFRHQFHQSAFIVTNQGVIITDPISREAAEWLKPELKKLTDHPVRYVVYSHDHADHITGGQTFADTATFISHWAARKAIANGSRSDTPLPDLTFTDKMFIDLGGQHVELIYTGKNHSDNSLVVLVPQDRLLFAVDFIPVETVAYRTMRSDYPDDWIESLKQVEQLDFDVLVPGHGKIGKKEHARQFRRYLEDLRAAVQSALTARMGLEEAKQRIRLPQYEAWQRYDDWFPENVEGMYRYLSERQKAAP